MPTKFTSTNIYFITMKNCKHYSKIDYRYCRHYRHYRL